MATADEELTQDERQLHALVPESGETISNPSLLSQLGWEDDERYWKARDGLVDRRLIVRGRGRGGTLRRISLAPPTEIIQVPVELGDPVRGAAQAETLIRRELDLYEPMTRVIGDWARDRRRSPLAIETTALQGRRATGGIWSRPDIVTVEIRTYAYVPGKFLEVITFEVKPADAIDV